MRFGILPPVRTGVTADPQWMTSFARHAESCGFESVVLVEHAVVVSDYQSTYPYSSSGKMPLPDDCSHPRPARSDGLSGRGHRAHRPGHRGAGPAQPSGGGAGQEDRHRRRALGRPGPAVRGGRVDGRGAAGHRCRPAAAGVAGPTRPSPPCAPCGPTPDRPAPDFDGEFFSFRHAHSYPQAGAAGRGAHPHRGAQRGRGAAGRSAGRRVPAPGTAAERPGRAAGIRSAGFAEEAGRDPAAIELSLVGLPPDHLGGGRACAESVGATRLVVSTSITPDLAQVRDEMSAFAERFGLSAGAGATAGAR